MRNLRLLHLTFVLLLAVTTPGNPQAQEEDQDDSRRDCIPRDFGKGSIVCVCNSTYCDSAVRVTLFSPDDDNTSSTDGQSQRGLPVQVWTSTKSGSRLHKSIIYFNKDGEEDLLYDSQHFLAQTDKNYFKGQKKSSTSRNNGFRFLKRFSERTGARFLPFFNGPLELTDAVTQSTIPSLNEISLFRYIGDFPRPNKLTKFTIRKDVQYQKILGFGGAFTDAAGINIASLSNATQENLMRSYFGGDGNDYSMARVPIGGTDFSTRPYTYDDITDQSGGSGKDLNLTSFSLQEEDFKLKIPYIQWAQSLRKGSPLKLIASPWSSPAWTKTSNSIKGKGILRPEYYQLWADYFVKFLKAYKEEKIDIWGVTTGNEPLNGFIPNWPFNSLGWSASSMSKFIGDNLGPTLSSLKGELDVKIITLDDNKGAIPTWSEKILDPGNAAARYVDGIGVHWYLDFLTGVDVLSRFHKKYPDYFIIQTEACLGFAPWELEKVILGSWERGEQYLEAIIRDMRNYVGGWLDWNVVLDLHGGPNWANLFADAAILVNPSEDEFFKQPIYYAIGHVSKFVPPDSVRIEVKVKDPPKNLHYIAFSRPDDAIVVVFLNRLNYDAKLSLFDETRGTLRLSIPAQSFQTIVYQ